MAQWSDGYVNDINYTLGYYTDLNPQQTILPLLMAGMVPPAFQTACELGFGQGISINTHAAASPVIWYGTDFNPAQTSFAQNLANAAGSGAALFDQSFAEFCLRTDLPDFDFIGLHGIWSWISAENRTIVVDFIRRKLKVGGILYMSYNTLPGWAAAAPLRHLLSEHAHVMGARGQGMLHRVQASFEFANKVLGLSHLYTEQVPSITTRLASIAKQNPHYLAHEYFNREWHPMYFAEMAQSLESTKVSYVCSSNFLDDFASINLTTEQQAFIAGIDDPMFAQTVKDFFLNKQFRRDYWVKGARTVSAFELAQYWRRLRFVLSRDRADVELKFQGMAGPISLLAPIYEPILDYLADFQIHAVADVEQAMQQHEIEPGSLFQALAILHAKGDITLAQDAAIIEARQPHCDRLNAHIMRMSTVNDDVSYLVSPVSGGAFSVPRISQLFLQAYDQGKTGPEAWADHAWQALALQKQALIVKGKTLESDEENLQELKRLAQEFEQKQLPILKALRMTALRGK